MMRELGFVEDYIHLFMGACPSDPAPAGGHGMGEILSGLPGGMMIPNRGYAELIRLGLAGVLDYDMDLPPEACLVKVSRPHDLNSLARAFDMCPLVLGSLLESGRKAYRVFTIPKKSGGRRTVEAPCKPLAEFQRKFLDMVVYHKSIPHEAAHGFVPGRSTRTCAVPHAGKRTVVKMDLKDFFPSVSRRMVWRGLWRCVDASNVKWIGAALELCLLDGRLPQGSPASPALSNLAMYAFDENLSRAAIRLDASYTRYADDITMSWDWKECGKLMGVAGGLASRHGLVVNRKKTTVMARGGAQRVVGLSVVEKGRATVPKWRRRKIRAALHNAITKGGGDMMKLSGEVAYIDGADKAQGSWFKRKLAELKEARRG